MRGRDVGLKAMHFMSHGQAIEHERQDEEDWEEGLGNDKSGTGTMVRKEALTAKNCGEPNLSRGLTLYPFIFQEKAYATSMAAAIASMRTTMGIAALALRDIGV